VICAAPLYWSATLCHLAPLHLSLLGAGHFKGLALEPSKFPAVSKYRELMKEQPAWKATDYGQEAVVKGWAAHMAGH
jgi:hypothetical protein